MMAIFNKSSVWVNDTLYMTRWTLGRLRLHIFYQGDPDPHPHDHPFDFWTFPLTSYVEEVISPKLVAAIAGPHGEYDQTMICEPSKGNKRLQVVRAFRISKRNAEHTHRVLGRWNGQSYTAQGWAYPGLPHGMKHSPGVRCGRVITIVWRGKVRRKWGFVKNNGNKWCWEYWRKFIDGGRNGACD